MSGITVDTATGLELNRDPFVSKSWTRLDRAFLEASIFRKQARMVAESDEASDKFTGEPLSAEEVFIYLFGVLRHFQHCTGHITTGFCTVNCRPTASNYQLSHLR